MKLVYRGLPYYCHSLPGQQLEMTNPSLTKEMIGLVYRGIGYQHELATSYPANYEEWAQEGRIGLRKLIYRGRSYLTNA
jgi:hypothetical protein